jgi:hypothetical protein
MTMIITSIIIILSVLAGVVYKAATKERKDIELTKHDVENIAFEVFKSNAAAGFKLEVCDHLPDEVIANLKDGKTSQGLVPEELVGLTMPNLGTKENHEDVIYIFVDGLRKQQEMLEKLGKHVSNRKLVEVFTLHECRHSQQIAALRDGGYDVEKAYAYEASCEYGKGPMEKDAIGFMAYPRVYGCVVKSSWVAKAINKKMSDPMFTAQYSISKMFG